MNIFQTCMLISGSLWMVWLGWIFHATYINKKKVKESPVRYKPVYLVVLLFVSKKGNTTTNNLYNEIFYNMETKEQVTAFLRDKYRAFYEDINVTCSEIIPVEIDVTSRQPIPQSSS